MPSSTDAPAAIRCSFCLKPAPEVESIISGPGIYICDECVRLCVHILENKVASDGQPSLPAWESMPDEEVLKTLPRIAAVAAQVEGSLLRWVAETRRRGTSWARIGAALEISRQSAWERFSHGEPDD